jgi:hypothetical protein
LSTSPARAADDGVRWRVFDEVGEALLVIADTDKATDNFGLPILSCKDGMGTVNVEGEAKENLRRAMADLIRTDQAPWIQVLPDTKPESASIDLFFSFIDGWRYKFSLQENHKAFERFKSEGLLEFKLGEAAVHEEFKVGLESVDKFLELCKPKPSKQ